jgi:dihydroorotate dehydrogenase electron transfer subunit
MTRELAKISDVKRLAQDIYSMWLNSPRITKQAKPGQFIMLQTSDLADPFLSRPMSIADVSKNKIRIIYRVIGTGTSMLREKKIGERLNVLGSLGKPVVSFKGKQVFLCAGGLGIAPLLFLAKQLKKNNKLHLYFGAKDRDELILLDEFKPLCEKIFLSTEDGSAGKKGLVTELLRDNLSLSSQYLFAAGPLAMIKKIQSLKLSIKTYAFLEERMGCGCGICFCCGVKKKNNSYLRTCTDGPVFDLSEIEL